MDLLPKSSTEFRSKNYWNDFFAKRGKKAFEWYGEYTELCGHLHKYIRPADIVLVPGCGNSTLSAELFKVGIRNVTNIDLSEVVISQMKIKYPEMKWIQQDMLNLDFSDETFTCVLDKGTFDALMSDDKKDNDFPEYVKYFSEINRITKLGARFICVSLLQENILDSMIKWFPQNGWIMRFSRCIEAEQKQAEIGSFSFPVFIVICTKFKKMDNFNPIIEINIHEGQMRRVSNFIEVKESITSLQQYAILKHNLRKNIRTEVEMKLELCNSENGTIRYCLFIVDSPKSCNNLQFAVFIVPHGRETEWLFGSKKGHLQLVESASANRLIIVHLMRDQAYGSIEDVQNELSSKVTELAPSNMMKQIKIPFLSVGKDLGERKEIYRGSSLFSGEFIIEDVKTETNQCWLRRLIFMNSQHIIQSEAKMIPVKRKKNLNKNGPSFVVDPSYLSCTHHLVMVGAMQFVSHSASTLLIGLGGGALATFLQANFPQTQIAAVDIDATMVEIAKTWFNFKCSERTKCHIADGLEFIKTTVKEGTNKYDIVMFDIDSKEHIKGLSCPPKQFVDKEFLNQVAKCINENGMFVLNLVCRDEYLKENLIKDLRSIFPIIISISIPEEVNNVLFCHLTSKIIIDKAYIEKKYLELNNYLKTKIKSSEDILNIRDIIDNITFYK